MTHPSSTGIAGEPPAALEKAALQLLGAPINGGVLVELLDGFRAVRLPDYQFEAVCLRARADLVNEVFAASVKAPEHLP